MRNNPSVRNLVLIWMGWALAMIAFQGTAGMRLELQRPDRGLSWRPGTTTDRRRAIIFLKKVLQ